MRYGELTNWIVNILQSPLTIQNKFQFPVAISWHEENTKPIFVINLEPGESHVMVNPSSQNFKALNSTEHHFPLFIVNMEAEVQLVDNMIPLYCTVLYFTVILLEDSMSHTSIP